MQNTNMNIYPHPIIDLPVPLKMTCSYGPELRRISNMMSKKAGKTKFVEKLPTKLKQFTNNRQMSKCSEQL